MSEYKVVQERVSGERNTGEYFLDAVTSMIYNYGKAKISNIIECLVEKDSDRCRAAKRMLHDVLVEIQRKLVHEYNVYHINEPARIEFVDSIED